MMREFFRVRSTYFNLMTVLVVMRSSSGVKNLCDIDPWPSRRWQYRTECQLLSLKGGWPGQPGVAWVVGGHRRHGTAYNRPHPCSWCSAS